MFIHSMRQGAGRALMALSLGIGLGLGAFNTSCSKNDSGYLNPAPAISAFTTGTFKNAVFIPTPANTTYPIAIGGTAQFRANFAVKDGSAVVTPGNISVVSNVPFPITNITTTTTYTLTVTSGDGQKATATSTVTVLAAPSSLTYTNEDATYYVGVEMSPNPPSVSGAAPFTYTVSPALPAGLNLDAATGAISGTPQVVSSQDTYVVTATNAVGSTTRNVKVTVADTPITFAVSPSTIPIGAGAILSWDASSVPGLFSSVNITANPADATLTGPFGLSSVSLPIGPTLTTTYTLTATPTLAGAPAVIKTVDLTVGNAPVHFTSFTAAPTVPPMGSSSTLSWKFTGLPLTLTLDGANVLGSSNKSVIPVRRQTYTLAGSNLLGGDTAQISVPAQGFDLLAGVPSSQGAYDGKGVNIRFGAPAAMAADLAGNIYWCDIYGHTVRMLTPDGQAKTIAGTPGLSGALSSNLKNPRGVVVTPDGNTLFVGDSGNFVIKKIVKDAASSTGYTMSVFSGITGSTGGADGVATVCTFGSPSGLAFDPTGNYLLVADYARNSIRQVSVADGSTITYAGNGSTVVGKVDVTNQVLSGATFSKVNAIAFNHAGTAFYVSDGGNFNIRMVTWNGPATSGAPIGSTYTVAGNGVTGSANGLQGSLSVCYAMAVDASENVYIADYTNGLIRKMTVAANVGTLSTVAGTAASTISKDGTGTAALFSKPQGLLLTNSGNTLLVAEIGGSGCIRSLDLPSTIVTTPYGIYKNAGFVDGTGPAATFNAPIGVTTDANNNVFVADTKNHLIRKITPAGVTSTIAGTAGVAGNVNNTGTLASFSSPMGIAIDAANNLYVADGGNKMIRMITPGGVVTTLATLPVAPTGIAVDPTKAGRLFVITSGTSITPIDGTTILPAITATPAFFFPATFSGITVDASGNLYVADRSNHVIRKVTDPLGTPVVTTLAGLLGTAGKLNGALGTNTLSQPNGIGMDADGNIFFSESGNNAIRRLDTTGNVSIVVANAAIMGTDVVPGSAPGVLPATITGPQALAVNKQGDILITTLDSVMQVTAPAGK